VITLEVFVSIETLIGLGLLVLITLFWLSIFAYLGIRDWWWEFKERKGWQDEYRRRSRHKPR